MSDTIRNEEKHIWRERLTSEVSCFNADLSAFTLRLLNALEQAEVENARLQHRVNELISEELTDGAVRERIQLRFNMHEVLQQNERLTKERDWLADKLSDHCLADGGDCNISGCPTYIACRNATPEVWKEAARRAVVAGEEDAIKAHNALPRALRWTNEPPKVAGL